MQALTYLRNRQLIFQTSQRIEEVVQNLSLSSSVYLGVDPTAKGLHVGHLAACRVLKHFHSVGVKSIALVNYSELM